MKYYAVTYRIRYKEDETEILVRLFYASEGKFLPPELIYDVSSSLKSSPALRITDVMFVDTITETEYRRVSI